MYVMMCLLEVVRFDIIVIVSTKLVFPLYKIYNKIIAELSYCKI